MASARKNSVVVVGSSNTDMILRVARVPRPGETLLGGEFSIAPGGKGANQAVARGQRRRTGSPSSPASAATPSATRRCGVSEGGHGRLPGRARRRRSPPASRSSSWAPTARTASASRAAPTSGSRRRTFAPRGSHFAGAASCSCSWRRLWRRWRPRRESPAGRGPRSSSTRRPPGGCPTRSFAACPS